MSLEPQHRDDVVRRLSAAVRGVTLYSADHPTVRRSVDGLLTTCSRLLELHPSLAIGFIGDEVVVNEARLTQGANRYVGLARQLHDRLIERITIHRGVTAPELRLLMTEVAGADDARGIPARFTAHGVRHITVGQITLDEEQAIAIGVAAARKLYEAAATTAKALWEATKAGEKPDPSAARRIIDSLTRLAAQDRASLLALTALKKYDDYTYTHMVNVSILTLAQARSLNIDGPLLREFGVAALMHDIGKVHTPEEILNKPDLLTKEEFAVMKRHVVDGAHILRSTPDMPALAPIVAFEHHLKLDLTGYPENVGHRRLNLCTMVVSIADVYDALRSTRPYRSGLATDRVRAIMAQQSSPAFDQRLLRRFINLVGMFPVGSLVRLQTEEIGVVTHEHPHDPFRPQVKVIFDARGERVETPFLLNTWEPAEPTGEPVPIVEALDAETLGIDPLEFLHP